MAWLYQTDVVIVKSFERTGLFLGVGAEAAQHPTSPPPLRHPPPARKNKKENIPKLLSRYSGITKIYLVVYYPVVLSFITRFAFLKRRMRLGQQYVIG